MDPSVNPNCPKCDEAPHIVTTVEHWLDCPGTVQARLEIFGATEQLPLFNGIDLSYGGGGGGGQSGQAIKLFQTTPYVSDSKHSTIPLSGSLYRRLENLVLPCILDYVKLAELSNNSFE